MSTSSKSVPVAADRDRPYWDGARAGILTLQRCVRCHLHSSQPRVVCPKCHGLDFEWVPVSGRGVIHSYSIPYQTSSPGFRDEVPYVIVHVQIEEEPTCYVTTNLLIEPGDFDRLDVGLPVEVIFEDRGETTVPQFQLAVA